MPVSPEVFKRVQESQPYKTEEVKAGEAQQVETDMQVQRESEKTSFGAAATEFIKEGFAGGAELYNAGARLFMLSINPVGNIRDVMTGKDPYEQFKGTLLEPGRAGNIVDQEKIKNAGPMAKLFGPALKGVGGMLTQPMVPEVKAGADLVKNITKVGGQFVKDVVVRGMGMGEGSEVGKYVFGGIGEYFFGEKGKEVGEYTGSVTGGALGAQANVIRMGAMGEVAGQTLKGAKAAVSSVVPAIKDTIAAKKAGDTRSAFDLFMDHYKDLKSKSVGMLQESTNQKVAGIIQRDPRHQEELKAFDEATRQADVDAGLFSIGQRSANPTLTQTEIQQKRSPEEAAAADAKKKGQQSAIAKAYKDIANKPLPVNQQEMHDSIETYRAGTEAKVDNLEALATDVKKAVPNWTDTQAAESGAKLRDIYDAEKKVAKGKTDQEYGAVYQAANDAGLRVDITPVAKATRDVLKPLISQIEKGTAPESIRSLNRLLTKEARAGQAAKEQAENVPFYMKRAQSREPSAVKGHSFQEVDRVLQQLNADAHDAFKEGTAEGTQRGKNLNKVGEALLDELYKQAPPEVVAAHQKANANYANQYAPRFKEGVNFNLDRQATMARKGREKITDQNVWSSYLNKRELVDNMQQFDNLFGGERGAPRNAAAYKGLSEAVGDKYSKDVLQSGFTREKHEKFMREYNSALDRVPDARKSMEATAQLLDKYNGQKETLLNQYKTVVGSPITQAVGPVQAQHLLLESLADPLKMKQLLDSPIGKTADQAKSVLKEATTFADPMKDGKYDPDKLVKLLTLGERRPGEPTPLQMLFNKAMGPQEGAAHATRLTAIAELMRREAMTDAKYMRFQPQGDKGAVSAATGQTMASWIGQFYATESGRIGKPFAFATAGGRFLNNEMQKAATRAMERALYDPAMSSAILELVQTPANQPISRSAWNAVFGAAEGSNKVLRNMIDHGRIRETIARGALYGHEAAVQDKREEKEKGKTPRRELRMPQ